MTDSICAPINASSTTQSRPARRLKKSGALVSASVFSKSILIEEKSKGER
jgi:hypothetical protein